MTATDRKLRVFLCHASQDKPVVRELYHRLLAEGWIDPWLDEKRLLPGQNWDMEIEKAVEAADVVIVCLSGNSVNKEGYVQRELRYVLDIALEKPDEKIFIIPIRLDNCQPPRRLRSWQYVDYFPIAQKEIAYRQILSSMQLRKNTLGEYVGISISSGGNVNTSVSKPAISVSSSNLPKSTSARKFTPSGFEIYRYGGVEFVKITKGKFFMGATNAGNAHFDEKPQHELDIPYDFWIGRFPITNREFELFAASSGRKISYPQGNENYPTVNVSMLDVQSFIRWINVTSKLYLPHGYEFILPSEAEWEKAARGTDGRVYPWGNTFDAKKCNVMESGLGKTSPVDKFSPIGDSPFGVADMIGNVEEFTRTLHSDMYKYPYNAKDGRESNNTEESMKYVMRGGCYNLDGQYLRSTKRNKQLFTSCHFYSFRLAIVPYYFR